MTPHELWTALPEETRERVDALVVRRLKMRAVKEMRESGVSPRPGLYDCAELVAARTEILADRLVPLPRQDVDALAGEAVGLPEPPVALELEWDGDTWGWILLLGAVLPGPSARPHPLAHWQQADWTEPLATARALADRLAVPLRGPGDDGPPGVRAE
ncbi:MULTISPECIES: hypothetical protein [unclassified Streptomyces]|uniref:hypothetical protein n=1 Tax=unclassified Streptomyces TaxID=2593676 RepID=UPI0006AEF38C|nr:MULTISPECIES: hypothetical protein [unclassified Streptomyces]